MHASIKQVFELLIRHCHEAMNHINGFFLLTSKKVTLIV